jgi:hypothetical protein
MAKFYGQSFRCGILIMFPTDMILAEGATARKAIVVSGNLVNSSVSGGAPQKWLTLPSGDPVPEEVKARAITSVACEKYDD